MAYLIRTVLKSGVQARGGAAYATIDEGIRAAGAQLEKGFAIDAWIENEDGARIADSADIKRRCAEPKA
jgi:hypothetical protein